VFWVDKGVRPTIGKLNTRTVCYWGVGVGSSKIGCFFPPFFSVLSFCLFRKAGFVVFVFLSFRGGGDSN